MIFPTLVYKCPGPHKKAGKLPTYDYRGAADQAQFTALIEAGWSATYAEAMDKAGPAAFVENVKKTIKKPKKVKPVKLPNPGYPVGPVVYKTTVVKVQKVEVVDLPNEPDDAPPTRAELEQKATELGIKFDGRTTDKKLAAKIAEAL